MSYRRRSRRHHAGQPWSPSEDMRVAEIARIRLDSFYWHLALPGRRFGEIVARRDELGCARGRII